MNIQVSQVTGIFHTRLLWIIIEFIGFFLILRNLLQTAYIKPLLHALKYPASAVNGVLLGSFNRGGVSVKISVTEAIPLLHSHISLSPMMDAAFSVLDEYCRCTAC